MPYSWQKGCTIFLITTLAVALAGCDHEHDTPDSTGDAATPAMKGVAGSAQKGPFQPGGVAAAFRLNADGSRGGTSVSSDIDANGGFNLAGIDWTGPTDLEISGSFFNEVTGNFTMGANTKATLHGLATLPDAGEVNVNLFTHFIAARVHTLMAGSAAFANARTQARDELAAIMGIGVAPSTLDLRHDGGNAGHVDDSANLLLFSAAVLAGGVNQAGIDAIATDFADDGQINGAGQGPFDAVKQATVDHPDLLATARGHLQNQYGVTPPNDTDGQLPAWAPAAGSVAAFTTSGPLQAGQTQSFVAGGSTGDGLAYAWDFGDGGSATGAQTTHVFADAGDYTVTLTLTDSAGQKDDTSRTIQIEAASQAGGPKAVFTNAGPAAAGDAVGFDGTGSNGAGLTYYWTFGDGDAGRNGRIPHVYDDAGNYDVTLTVTDSGGSSDTASQTVTIGAGPQPAANNGILDGTVIGTDGNPLQGVQAHLVNTPVRDDGHTAITDADGKAALSNMPTGVDFVLKLTKDRYADQFVRTTIPPNSTGALFSATMIEREPAQTLANAENGGSVTGSDGATIDLPANALVDGSGNPVSGDIKIALTPVDVSDEKQRGAFPGSFAAADQNGDSGLLLSFGVAEYQLTQGGKRLQLAAGKQATLTVPIYIDSHSDGSPVTAGDNIPLWSLDETTGEWIQEGTGSVVASSASPTGLAFEITAGHLSWYNSDAFLGDPYGVIPHCKVDNSSGLPTLKPSETCVISASLRLGSGGPFYNASANISGNNSRALRVPSNNDVQLLAIARNGKLVGSTTVNGSSGTTDSVDILLQPVGNGGGEAITLPYDETQAGPAGEVDRYQFTGQAGKLIHVAVDTASVGSTLQGTLELLGPSGQSLGKKNLSNTVPADLFAKLPADGSYTISVDGTANELNGYRLSAQTTPYTNIDIDQNLEAPLAPGASKYFVFSGPAGDVIGIANVGKHGIQSSDIPVFQVTDLATNDVVGGKTFGAPLLAALPDDGDYLLTISNNTSRALSYRTAVASIEPPQPLQFDSAQRARVNGSLTVYGERKFYSFQGNPGDSFLARLDSRGGAQPLSSGLSVISLYKPDSSVNFYQQLEYKSLSGSLQGDFDDTLGDPQLLFTSTGLLPGSGGQQTYVVAVAANETFNHTNKGSTLGDYSLRVDNVAPRATIVVDDDLAECPNADTRSVRAAVRAVADGGRVEICKGRYADYLDIARDFGEITIAGRDRSGVILAGLNNPQGIFGPGRDTINLESLTLESQGGSSSGGIGTLGDITNVTVKPPPGAPAPEGGFLIDTDGTVIDGLDLTAGSNALFINADNVTVKNSHFTGSPGRITAKGKNLLFENNTLDISEAAGSEFVSSAANQDISGGVRFLHNTITITSANPGKIGEDFGIHIDDDGNGNTGAVIRGNTVHTDAGGLNLQARGAGAAFTVEQNRITSTAPAGGQLLQAAGVNTNAGQATKLTVRNNVFDGMAALGGNSSGLNIIQPAKFSAVEVINNSFRAKVNSEFRDDNAGMMSLTGGGSSPASYPVRLRNNIFQGIGDANKADTAIQITSGVTIDADYDLFFGFDTVYAGGSTSAGGNDVTGQDPQYTDNDLNVDPTSPAVNAGAAPMADGPSIPAEDIDGVARPQGANYDIGAHEYEP